MEVLTYIQQILEEIPISSVLDFTIIAFIIYGALYFLRGTRGAAVLAGIIFALLFARICATKMEFTVLSRLLNSLDGIVATAIIVIFQPELRRAFAQLGTVAKAFSHTNRKDKLELITQVVDAVMQMSYSKTGALIVFERNIGMQAIINSGVTLDAKINPTLLRSIFYPNSPLHDGAVVIRDDKIVAAHVILTLSQDASENIEKRARALGTRHHAAISITEETDSVAVVVSEETGIISVAYRGCLTRNYDERTLKDFLKDTLIHSDNLSSQLRHAMLDSTSEDDKNASFLEDPDNAFVGSDEIMGKDEEEHR